MTLFKTEFASPLGSLTAYSDGKSLRGLFFEKEQEHLKKMSLENATVTSESDKILQKLKSQLVEYFSNKRKTFELPLELQGTEFQIKAWQTLQKIPYGEKISYSKQAQWMGSKNAVRATGSANGKNLFPILIPCHRVVRADGDLGGYSAGLEIKEKLLRLEQASA